MVRSSDSQYASAGTAPSWPWAVENGPCWRIPTWTIRRFLLRDRVVMATAGMHAPF